MSILDELQWRGMLHQTTAPDALREHIAAPGRVIYAGFDPTAPSLTIGNFIPIKLLMHWQRAGHRPVFLVGGGTGLIGDPSGKDAERTLMTRDQVQAHVDAIRRIFEHLVDFDPKAPNGAIFVDNADWLCDLGYIEVLRDVGKHFSVNEMITRDSVRTRLEEREHGISYTEFSYMILQAYDFLHLRRTLGCTIQTAGSDQFGNIVSGIDLIRREFGHEEGDAYGVTAPLVTKADGKKIGKTESGAIWLSADRTSPYAFFQYWINTADEDVESFLKWFTFLEADEIAGLMAKHGEAPHERTPQKALARQMTALLHGESELRRVESATEALFGGDLRGLDERTLAEVFADVPNSEHGRDALGGDGVALVELLPQTSLASSKREARQFLESNAVAVNGEKVGMERKLTAADLLGGRTIALKRGRKNWHITRWI